MHYLILLERDSLHAFDMLHGVLAVGCDEQVFHLLRVDRRSLTDASVYNIRQKTIFLMLNLVAGARARVVDVDPLGESWRQPLLVFQSWLLQLAQEVLLHSHLIVDEFGDFLNLQ